jgi:hypothetical protein
MKYKMTIEVDEAKLREATNDNESSVEFLIRQEMGWTAGGIFLTDIEKEMDADEYADELANNIV